MATDPPGRYCPYFTCVIGTVRHYFRLWWIKEDGGIEPLSLHLPWFSRPVAILLAASSLRAFEET